MGGGVMKLNVGGGRSFASHFCLKYHFPESVSSHQTTLQCLQDKKLIYFAIKYQVVHFTQEVALSV